MHCYSIIFSKISSVSDDNKTKKSEMNVWYKGHSVFPPSLTWCLSWPKKKRESYFWSKFGISANRKHNQTEFMEEDQKQDECVFLFYFQAFPLWNGVQVKTHKRRIKSRGWMDYRSFVCVQLTPDEPRCALVSIKHHLITGCVFIIIIVIIIIIINRLPSLKSETMDSP